MVICREKIPTKTPYSANYKLFSKWTFIKNPNPQLLTPQKISSMAK